jgi:hypothetical protein
VVGALWWLLKVAMLWLLCALVAADGVKLLRALVATEGGFSCGWCALWWLRKVALVWLLCSLMGVGEGVRLCGCCAL